MTLLYHEEVIEGFQIQSPIFQKESQIMNKMNMSLIAFQNILEIDDYTYKHPSSPRLFNNFTSAITQIEKDGPFLRSMLKSREKNMDKKRVRS